MYAFARRPRWLLSHVLVVVLVVVMIALGLWQLQRLDERRDRNAEISERTAASVVPIGELVRIGDPLSVGAELQYRLASATGEYDPAGEVLVRNRTLEGRPGYWVLTPLVIDGTTTVLVNRGWVPAQLDEGAPTPPTGPVTVVGMVQATRVAEGIQNADPADGVLDFVGRPDIARVDQQYDGDLLPVYLQLETQEPPVEDLPTPLPRPELDEGPHFGYAMQWFIFTAIAIVGYPLVLRRVARNESGDHRRSDIPDEYL